jgi:hypothetical protein
MHDGLQGNAMTEVALALAMGFFSILVLALVSMGAGGESETGTRSLADVLQPALVRSSGSGTATTQPDDQIVIYHHNRLLDSNLTAIRIEDLAPDKRVVLALAPTVPLDEIMKIYALFDRPDLVVSTLDERWLARLGTRPPDAAERSQ